MIIHFKAYTRPLAARGGTAPLIDKTLSFDTPIPNAR